MSPFVYYPNKTKTKVYKKQIFTQKDYRLAKSMPLKCLASYFLLVQELCVIKYSLPHLYPVRNYNSSNHPTHNTMVENSGGGNKKS